MKTISSGHVRVTSGVSIDLDNDTFTVKIVFPGSHGKRKTILLDATNGRLHVSGEDLVAKNITPGLTGEKQRVEIGTSGQYVACIIEIDRPVKVGDHLNICNTSPVSSGFMSGEYVITTLEDVGPRIVVKRVGDLSPCLRCYNRINP